MMRQRRLLVDAGNSSVKWAVVIEGAWLEHGRCDYVDIGNLKTQLTSDMDCFVASVARSEQTQLLRSMLELANIETTWLESESDCCGVENGYSNPRQLGVDRWMGLAAARQRTHEPALVVSVGTAVTVDSMSAEGLFLGGLILPGVDLMRQVLHEGTANVGGMMGHWQAFPRNTADAVHSGIVAALCGAIHHQHALLADREKTLPHCFVTGGNAELLMPHLRVTFDLVPALVLEGIECVAREKDAR